ncbi:MAG: cbb3-type cytochrome c oxidase subunit 3 [Deferribacteraceae bacterium]|jgi:cbb3-type cytochrome oxidase subunit 3|nr:cbb3-type cytochrome c oxidase subunit 3 [Deferribacteraceae bacterium]
MTSVVTGGVLCVLMVIVWVYFFSPKRKKRIEQPKYDILKDEDE